MTIEERAKLASRGAGCGRPLSDEDVQVLREFIAEQIAAAIEEEREACARDADDEAVRARELQARRGDYGGDMFRAGVTQGRAQASSLIAARIRARSVNSP